MPSRRKKFIFLVQGEGRGHMTQAISLYQILTENGQEVLHVFIGKSKRREVPDFFYSAFDVPVEQIDSPNFITDSLNRSIRLVPSILYNFKYLNRFRKSLKRIDEVIQKLKPNAIINFYDFLGGFYNFLYNPAAKFFAVGHQFLTGHPKFEFVKGKSMHKYLFIINNYLNSFGAYKKMALSFTPYEPLEIGKIVVVPPLLRNEIHDLEKVSKDFILGYMVNDGYSQEIVEWSQAHPQTSLHIFWDKKDEPPVKNVSDNLTFHRLNAKKFLKMMAECQGLVTTAGFESICEAMYIGKPVLMIPVSGQYEQACNAIDAVKAGAGIQDNHFNISLLIDYISNFKDESESFKRWYEQGRETFIKELTDF
jgi:uncharacterized protein (TIGR00661 family)